MINFVIMSIYWISNAMVILLLLRAILSWFVTDAGTFLGRLYLALIRFTEPIIIPFRRFLSRFNTRPWDFSIALAILVIQLAARFIIRFIVALVV